MIADKLDKIKPVEIILRLWVLLFLFRIVHSAINPSDNSVPEHVVNAYTAFFVLLMLMREDKQRKVYMFMQIAAPFVQDAHVGNQVD